MHHFCSRKSPKIIILNAETAHTHTQTNTRNGPKTICIDSHAHRDQRVEIYGQAFSIPLGAQV